MKTTFVMPFLMLAISCSSDSNNVTNNDNHQNNGVADIGSDMIRVNNAQPDMKTDASISTPDLAVDLTPDIGGEFQTGIITFFDLPIGSIRYATSMILADEGVTVTAIWFGSQFPACDEDFNQNGNFPYIYVEPTLNPMAWDYSPNATYSNPDGCVEFETAAGVGQDVIDLKMDIQSADFDGSVYFKSP